MTDPEVTEGVENIGPPTIEITTDILSLVLAPDDMPSREGIERLTDRDREQVALWAGRMHLEASDNDVKVGPAPKCLRRILSPEHYLQRWRVTT